MRNMHSLPPAAAAAAAAKGEVQHNSPLRDQKTVVPAVPPAAHPHPPMQAVLRNGRQQLTGEKRRVVVQPPQPQFVPHFGWVGGPGCVCRRELALPRCACHAGRLEQGRPVTVQHCTLVQHAACTWLPSQACEHGMLCAAVGSFQRRQRAPVSLSLLTPCLPLSLPLQVRQPLPPPHAPHPPRLARAQAAARPAEGPPTPVDRVGPAQPQVWKCMRLQRAQVQRVQRSPSGT